MQIGPILEKALLERRAFFRTASLGFNGVMSLKLNRNKSYIITKIRLESLWNVIDTPGTFVNGAELYGPQISADLTRIYERSLFQLVVMNTDFNDRYTIKAKTSITADLYYDVLGESTQGYTKPTLEMEAREIETYYVTNQSIYFYLVYPNFRDLGAFDLTFDIFSNFFQEYNNLPQPATGPDRSRPGVLQQQSNLAANSIYVPLTDENIQAAFINQFQSNTIKLPIDNFNPNGFVTEYIQPSTPLAFPFAVPIQPFWLPSLPNLQIEYFEINEKLDPQKGVLGIL
jgi:hypothetical protein